ncbi:MAG: ATP-binding protein [Candidatus Aureabacteria bacterium]|nr:ATP-binding protein [Candidatus Auribacterota bacterium]
MKDRKKSGKMVPKRLKKADIIKGTKFKAERGRPEEDYKIILRTAMDGFWIADMQGRILEVNNAYCRMVGYSHTELLSMSIKDVEAAESAEDIANHIDRIVKAGSDRFETKHRCKDGKILDVEVSIHYIKGRDGRVFMFLRDITEHKQTEKKIVYLASFPELNPNPVVEMDSSRNICYLNSSARRLFSGQGVKGAQQIFLGDLESVIDYFHRHGESSMLREIKIGSRWFSQQIHYVPETRHIRIYGLNITESKKTEEASKKAEDEEKKRMMQEVVATAEKKRADELDKLYGELKDAQEKLVRTERLAAMGELAGTVSHELRNPLGVIKNAVYYLKNKLGQFTRDEKMNRYLEIIDEAIEHADRVISDVLTSGGVRRPSLSKSSVNDVIQSCLGKTVFPKNIIIIKGLKGELPEIPLDVHHIAQALSNLLVNAVEAMPEGGMLTIQNSKKDMFIEITIADTGVGIPKENLGKIFEPLFSTKQRGIGLGLAICRGIIEGHKGTINVASEVGRGTTFTIKLPIG